MSLSPLLNASLAIQIHAFLAIAAVVLTIAIFTLPRGSTAHRWMGWSWVTLMAIVALSSFGIHEIRMVGPFGPIHILSDFVLFQLVINIRATRTKNIRAHSRGMKLLSLGALVGAGAFTFLPGRIMYQVVAGG
ncbi:DUF2306 domain-containing protein [Sulfitobacter sp. CW3]|uniref:DUF2306 domain-containing protein n=1 Tax=Sulfitobacter sp. CW3 TaxID=2861965 RepID=UPI001C5F4255|nr:DUF2306 domain-containing protein [Sulfitobacter sp. CW3]MBW4961198.1 DUF2306 domain-containing protein [Sulfitobacter sp. CW3]